jgi:hypothetical protein
MSEKDFRRFKKWLKGHLAFGPTTVVFTKKDGTEREMLCTTNSDIAPFVAVTEDKKERKINEEVCAVYDIEAKGWRSFRWDSIKSVRFDLGG